MSDEINFTLFKHMQTGGRKKKSKKYKIINKYNINDLKEKPLMILKITDDNILKLNEKINYK